MYENILTRVRARASNPVTIHDLAKGLSPSPHLYPNATPEQIAETEAALGFALPQLLKQILSEIGNGGFGPGYGLIGAHGGYDDFGYWTLEGIYQAFHDPTGASGWPVLPTPVLPVCSWGCGIYSCLDCSKIDAPVLIFNPGFHVLESDNLQATLTSPEGEVLWTSQQQCEARARTEPDGIHLIQHKESFAAWTLAWAEGINLWEEMEKL